MKTNNATLSNGNHFQMDITHTHFSLTDMPKKLLTVNVTQIL